MSVKRMLICVIKHVQILLVPTCVSVMMATHWESTELLALVRDFEILTAYLSEFW